MDLHLSGKVVAITGGSEGIGKATAMAFAKEGCKVAICSRSQAKLDAAQAEFREAGYDLYTKSVDVSISEQLYGFVDEVYNQFGRIDIWINNTAMTIVKSILELELSEWEKIMKTNLDSYFIGTQAAGRYMKESGGGVIVNVASFGGIMPPMYRSAYCTSKHAINWLTRCSAAEFAPFGIRVNAAAPGTINTAMQKAAGRTSEDVAKVAKNFALHRPGESEEVANVILFLASDMSSYCDGIVVECSGGKFLAQDCDTAWTQMR
jgi:NAD(P)-dependent dehydrogenase (short-subunit alcohol dehydrogenase family)